MITARPSNHYTAEVQTLQLFLPQVRAREAAKRARDMTRSTTENKELEMLSRLPEMARIIRNSFVTEKKAALPWEMIAAKVAASYSSLMSSSEL